MDFRHPDLRRYQANLSELKSGDGLAHDSVDDPIYQLMAMVDYFRMAEWDAGGSLPSGGDTGWAPMSPELSEVIQRLMSAEQREGLRRWYDTREEMNATASGFRDWLAVAINEPLKPQQAGASDGDKPPC